MNLPVAGSNYSQGNEHEMRRKLEAEDRRNLKIGAPVLIQSPNGTFWKLVVDNSGNLTTEEQTRT